MNRDHIKINWTFDRGATRRKFDYESKSFKRSDDPAHAKRAAAIPIAGASLTAEIRFWLRTP
jgi:hypothetical protein